MTLPQYCSPARLGRALLVMLVLVLVLVQRRW
jgi:hypothetical protein